MNEDSTTKVSISGMPPSPELRSASAPFTAMIRPRLVQLK